MRVVGCRQSAPATPADSMPVRGEVSPLADSVASTNGDSSHESTCAVDSPAVEVSPAAAFVPLPLPGRAVLFPFQLSRFGLAFSDFGFVHSREAVRFGFRISETFSVLFPDLFRLFRIFPECFRNFLWAFLPKFFPEHKVQGELN